MPRDAVAPATGHGTARPASAAEITAGPMDHAPAAGLRDLCRPATVVLVLIPLGMLGAGTSTGGRLAVVTAIAAAALIAAAAVLLGLVPIRHTYSWIAVFAGLLTVSFAYPSVAPPPAPGERHGAVDLVGPLRGMAATDLGRFFDLAGILTGLALLGVSLVTSPHPRRVARVIALSGTAAAAYVLVRGGFDNVRLEGLGCNPNYLGFLLALPAVTALGLVRHARNPRWLVPASVCALALSETHSRSAFLAAAVGSAIVLLQGHSRLFQGALVSAGAATAIAVAAGGMLRPMGRRIENLGAGGRTVTDLSLSNGLRRRVAEFALQVITDHPLRGIGLSTFPGYAQRSPRFGAYLATHDEYLRLAAEAGVITLILFLVLLWLGLGRRQAGDLALLRAVVLTYAVILLFANPLANLVVSVPFWVSMGCLLASRPDRGVTTAALVAGAVRAVRNRRGRTSFVRSAGEGAEPRA